MSAVNVSDMETEKAILLVKGLAALAGLLTALSGWMGFSYVEAEKTAEMTREQVTNVVNHYYTNCRD